LNVVFVDICGLTLDFTGWEVLQRFNRGAKRSLKGFHPAFAEAATRRQVKVFSNPPVRLDWVLLQC
jgi:hypothetical protein